VCRLLQQDILIVQLVIIVIKSHYAAYIRMLGVCVLRFIIAVKRHLYRLLNEVSRVNNSVCMELLQVFQAPDSAYFLHWLLRRYKVRVSRKILNSVTHFFTRVTAHVYSHHRIHFFFSSKSTISSYSSSLLSCWGNLQPACCLSLLPQNHHISPPNSDECTRHDQLKFSFSS